MDETDVGAIRAPSGRLPRPVRTLTRWYRSPQQELMRRELLWTLRWLKSPLGLVLLFAQLLVPILFRIMSSMDLRMTFSSPFLIRSNSIFYGFFTVAQLLLTYGAWAYLYQLRCIAPFRSGRLHDLLLSDLKATSLWPGLFMAPVAVGVCFKILLLGLTPLTGGNTFFIKNFVDFVPSFHVPLSYALFSLFHLAHGLVFTLAISAFVSCFVVPKGGGIRSALFLSLGILISVVPYRILSGVIILPLFSGEWIPIYVVARESFRLAIEILVFWICMKWLHSERFWERLRGHVEIAQPPN